MGIGIEIPRTGIGIARIGGIAEEFVWVGI